MNGTPPAPGDRATPVSYGVTYLILGALLALAVTGSMSIGAFMFPPLEILRFTGEKFGWLAGDAGDTLARNVREEPST
ncbi:MAG TPA: hypothetical protein VHX61_11525 [Rhizomicrobium sp.]|nr:hypothetical protein [Rhizomicrobium sp.]